jgi:hypothetical protein
VAMGQPPQVKPGGMEQEVERVVGGEEEGEVAGGEGEWEVTGLEVEAVASGGVQRRGWRRFCLPNAQRHGAQLCLPRLRPSPVRVKPALAGPPPLGPWRSSLGRPPPPSTRPPSIHVALAALDPRRRRRSPGHQRSPGRRRLAPWRTSSGRPPLPSTPPPLSIHATPAALDSAAGGRRRVGDRRFVGPAGVKWSFHLSV